MTLAHASTDTLLCLLRNEQSAYESYRLALAQQWGHLLSDSLLRICREHITAVDHLRLHACRHGGSPDGSAPLWESFAQALESDAPASTVAALGALREGERNGLVMYLDVSNDRELPPECRNLIRLTLLPQTENHIAELDKLIELAE